VIFLEDGKSNGLKQEYIRRLRNSAIFSLQQQFLCMQNSYPIVTFCFFNMEFAGYHQANRETGKNMATLNYKFIFFALTSEC
jgi:hypothetical protein